MQSNSSLAEFLLLQLVSKITKQQKRRRFVVLKYQLNLLSTNLQSKEIQRKKEQLAIEQAELERKKEQEIISMQNLRLEQERMEMKFKVEKEALERERGMLKVYFILDIYRYTYQSLLFN